MISFDLNVKDSIDSPFVSIGDSTVIRQLLVNAAAANIVDELRHPLGKDSPVPQLAQHHHSHSLFAEMSDYRVDVFDLHPLLEFPQPHHRDFDSGKKIRAESLQMSPRL